MVGRRICLRGLPSTHHWAASGIAALRGSFTGDLSDVFGEGYREPCGIEAVSDSIQGGKQDNLWPEAMPLSSL